MTGLSKMQKRARSDSDPRDLCFSERLRIGASLCVFLLLTQTGETEWSELLTSHLHQIKAQRSGLDLERKKEITDMEFSRPLRKPGKRNGVSFF